MNDAAGSRAGRSEWMALGLLVPPAMLLLMIGAAGLGIISAVDAGTNDPTKMITFSFAAAWEAA